MATSKRLEIRRRRQARIRKKVTGSTARPRLCIFRSARHITAQIIDDVTGKTIVSAGTVEKEARSQFAGLNKKQAAGKVGQIIAERAKAANISQVVFDRNGFTFHGRVKELADGARSSGLDF
ncbi:MAG: 50S ribosomal protein L18 [Myxococcota bacterium]|nr:50S ribosomal protein L18 [Myxococcota bacterium]